MPLGKVKIWLAFALVFTAPLSLSLFGQQTTATLVGTITDPSGSVVSGSTVTILNLQTGLRRDAKSDATGDYTVPFLPAGEYSATASMAGFRQSQVSGITLVVGQTSRYDFQMEVGDVTQSVNVQASAVALQTENATVGTTIDSTEITELPLNGRNFVQLAQLIPGAQPGTPGSITVRRGRGSIGQSDSAFGSTGFSANGVRDTANRYYIDGIESMDGDAFTYAFSPSVDSLAELKVETNSYAADSGAAPGGQISLTTKSGTNSFHGTLWEFNRNDALTSTYDAIANKDLKSARLNRNQYGANVGGPVLIPKLYHGKNKTFFFFNWESGRQALGAVPGYAIVPTSAQRTGDLSGLTDNKGNPIVLRDPLHVGIVGNVIPTAALSPQALTYLKFEPAANTQNGVFNFINTPQSPISTQDNYTGRVDHNLSSKDSISGRYILNDTLEKGTPFWGHDDRNNLSRTQNVAATYTRTFSSNIVNLLRVGWNRMHEGEVFGTTNDPAYNVAGLMNIPLVSSRPKDYGPPSIQISGPEGGISTYDLQRQIGPRDRSYGLWEVADGLSWQHGRHALRLGFEIDRRNYYFEQARNPRGSFRFDGTYTGSALADFLLGYVKLASINPTPTVTDMYSTGQAYYVNDEWKAATNLTVTLGLRYDYFQRWYQSDNKIIDVYQNGFLVTDFATPQNSPYGRSLLRPDRNNFGPRAGLAWRPSFLSDTVFRAGYGIYYQQEHPNANFSMVEGAQALLGASIQGSGTTTPDLFFNNPFAKVESTTGTTLNNTTSIDPNERDAYIQQWNATIQHQFRGNILLDVGYVGTKGTDLSIAFDDGNMAFNRPVALVDPRDPSVAPIDARRPNQKFQRDVEGTKSVGNSNYNALQVRAERRMGRGLTFLTAYTWSKALSGPHDQGGLIGNGGFIGNPQDFYNMRNEHSLSGYDLTQRFAQTVVYDVPFFHSLRGAGKWALDGWQLSTIVVAESGFPAGIDYGVDSTGTGVQSRADVVLGQVGNLSASQRTWQRWFNTAAFAPAQWGHFGTTPRTGAIRLPGLINADFSLNKEFAVGERARVELRSEFFNLFNHFNPTPGSVDRNVQSRTFGAVGGGVQGITTRVIQLGAKIRF
jgi:outer membrane receptor protein involved in Fe transport